MSDAPHVIFNLYNHSAKYYFLPIIHIIKLKHSSLPEITELEEGQAGFQLSCDTQTEASSSIHIPCSAVTKLLGDLMCFFFKTEFLRNLDKRLRTLKFSNNIGTHI